MQDNPVVITRAVEADLDDVLSILDEAAQWLWTRDIPQWLPGSIKRQDFVQLISHRVVWIARLNGTPVGTVTVNWTGRDIWGPDDGKAGYIHKLAVRRSVAGQGVSTALLRSAEEHIVERNRPLARLDCRAESEALRRFYVEHGFVLRGIVMDKIWKLALFEKNIQSARDKRTAPSGKDAQEFHD